MLLLKFFLDILLLAIIVYSKVLPYRDRLSPSHAEYFMFMDRLISPISIRLGKVVKPVSIGNGVLLDMSHFAIMAIVIFLINLL